MERSWKATIYWWQYHGMCLVLFQGEGYSDLFVAHKGKILWNRRKRILLAITLRAQMLSARNAQFRKMEAVMPILFGHKDQKVLSVCGLEEGGFDLGYFSKLVSERKSTSGEAKEICGMMQME